jgi:diguanylate cyclase (GGDEF)-like protein
LRIQLERQAADLRRANEQLQIEIGERKRYEEKLEYFSVHDPLTGLFNRRSLEEMLNRTVARAKRGVVSALLYMDLDNFKEVNDTVGHAAGDEVLKILGGLLKAELRTEDVIFRVGGDEFAVLFEGIDGERSLTAAQRLRVAVEAHPLEAAGRVFRLGLSIGLIEIDGTLATEVLLSQADAAMYRAKERGKNRVVQALVALEPTAAV